MKINIPDIPDLNQLVWRYLYIARMRAAEGLKANIPQEDWKISPWLEILCDDNIPKTFQFDEIDKVQYQAIINKMRTDRYKGYGADCMYHNLIRPMERLFTVDMPLNGRLIAALTYCEATEDLGLFIKKLVGWERCPDYLSEQSVIEELSKIRTKSLIV